MIVAWIITLFLGWQVQGGYDQTIQFTANNEPQHTVSVEIQGSQENTDNLQPAMGVYTLNQPFTGTLEVR